MKAAIQTAGASSNFLTKTLRAGGIRRRAFCAILCLLISGGLSVWAATANSPGKKHLKVFDANAYIGADLAPALTVDPSNISNVLQVVTELYMTIVASEPPTRMAGLAREIASANPDLVGLEELYTLETAPATAQGVPGEFTVLFDYLQLLTNALAAQGAHYQVAVIATESDIALPMFDLQTGGIAYARAIDHEVILARADLPPGHLRLSNPQSGHFTHYLQVPGTGIEVLRGWCSVDVFSRGERLRFVCTHLEEETLPELQLAQALELLAGPGSATLPLIMTGDFNADPLHRNGTITYDALIGAGFSDAWADLNPSNPAGGLTWGHDALLADPAQPFTWRIDLVLFRGAVFSPVQFDVTDLPLNRPSPPLWASDHAAVDAGFMLANPKASHVAHAHVGKAPHQK